jgi:hypothetical protein
MHNVLSKNMPRFLTNEALVTIVPSKERQHSENSFTRCFSANTISSVLSWFNLSIFELINTLTSDKQVKWSVPKIMASANFTDWFCSTIWALRHNFEARHIEDALNLTLLKQQRHVEFGHSNRTSSTSELRKAVLTAL